jgi:hypothetical protein
MDPYYLHHQGDVLTVGASIFVLTAVRTSNSTTKSLFAWNADILSYIFPSPINVEIIIQNFQSYKAEIFTWFFLNLCII